MSSVRPVRHQIKSNQIALLAKAPLIRSTGAPSTGYNYEIWNNTMSINKKLKKTKVHNAVKMSIVYR